MTPNVSSSGNRFILLIITALLVSSGLHAQRTGPRKTASTKSFLDTQWWLGIRSGMTFAKPVVLARYYGFSPINYTADENDKEFSSFSEPGVMAGLDIIFYHKGFSIGFHPSFKSLKYGYEQRQTWTSNDVDALETIIAAKQTVQYVEVPFMVKYDVIRSGKIRPFVQAGWQYSFLIDASKDASITQRDFITDPPQQFSGGQVNFGNKTSFTNYTGAIGGIGVNLDYLNIRTVVEIIYQQGLSPVTSKSDPFMENELAAFGDAQDKVSLNQLSFSVSFIFPLRFIDNTFSPY